MIVTTNKFDGVNFVNSAFVANTSAAAYAKELFPGITDEQAATAGQLYESAGLGGDAQQAAAIMGECKHFPILLVSLS
jgi:hypothetical protein